MSVPKAKVIPFTPGPNGTENARPQTDLTKKPLPIITAAALAQKTFPEPRWAVPGIVPEGAALLVGRPKQGKSWLLLALGIAIASGGRALGQIPVPEADVLLLCLEDNQRRLQDRMWRILDGEAAPERLHLVTEWPRLDEGGAEQLDQWLADHPATALVGIDVLARMRQPGNGSGDLYARDYALMAAVKAIADAHGTPLAAVHHSRKASADDPFDTISGTNGLAAAADTALILTRERGAKAANLYVRGRDVPEADYALTFDEPTCRWHLAADAAIAAALTLPPNRASIVKLLSGRGPLTPAEIADALKSNRGTVRSTLHRMYHAGQVAERDGRYFLPAVEGATGATGATDGVTTPTLPVAPTSSGVQQVQQGESNGLLQVLQGATGGATGKTDATTPNVAGVAPVAGDMPTTTPVPPDCGQPAICAIHGPGPHCSAAACSPALAKATTEREQSA